MESNNEQIEDEKKRKRGESSVSELEISKTFESTDDNSPNKLTKKQMRRKKKKDQKAKKAKIQEEMQTLELTKDEIDADIFSGKKPKNIDSSRENLKDISASVNVTNTAIDKDLKEIKEILKNVLTKDDHSLKQLIVDTIKEMKDDLLNSMSHRIDILENEIYTKSLENDNLKEELKKMKQRDEKQTEENKKLSQSIKQNKNKTMEHLNDLEQYQRRNNIRITGLEDNPNETAEKTANKICTKLNEHMEGLDLDTDDIDIAHRLGKYKADKTRSVIVRFISRNMKYKIMQKRKLLAGSDIFLNEDLTALNQEVLNSVRLKRKKDVLYAYTFEGKIFAKWSNDDTVSQIHYENFDYWLNLKWPTKEKTQQKLSNSD